MIGEIKIKRNGNMNLFIGILLSILGQVLVFFQVQGTVKYQFLQDHKMWVIIMGMPITWIFIILITQMKRMSIYWRYTDTTDLLLWNLMFSQKENTILYQNELRVNG